MKALSVRAPWWWAILHLGKDIENREWPTKFRGTVLLHAGKWFDEEEISYDIEDSVAEMYLQSTGKELTAKAYDLSIHKRGCGCIVGKIDIVDCVTSSKSSWFVGRYGFVLANPVAFAEPISFKGALGFFDVPDSLIVGKERTI